jgi:hypothetical protein
MGRNGLGSAEKRKVEGLNKKQASRHWPRKPQTLSFRGQDGSSERGSHSSEGWMGASSAYPGRSQLFWWWNAGATGGVRIRRSAFAPGTYPCCPPWIRYLAARRSEARCSGLYRSRCPCTSSRYTPPEYSIVCLGWRLTGQVARKLRGVSQFLQQVRHLESMIFLVSRGFSQKSRQDAQGEARLACCSPVKASEQPSSVTSLARGPVSYLGEAGMRPARRLRKCLVGRC